MQNKLNAIKVLVLILSISTIMVFFNLNQDKKVSDNGRMNWIIDRMPLVKNDPFASMAASKPPEAERGVEVQKWLESGVRIAVSGARGSGTIVYYDPKTGFAYIQSCGHLWNGDMTAQEGEQRKLTCTIDVFYINGKKINPKTYPAEVLWYSNNKDNNGHLCQDVSLIRFKSDFVPKYFPIAPADTTLQQGEYLHSVGCDHATEVAHYKVRVLGERGNQWPDLVTTENSPRPGRSGGGLISDSGFYVGICWGTSDYDGNGNGFFTPLRTIRYFNEKNGYGWLNNVTGNVARTLPIFDRNNPQGKYPDTYIPMPGGR